MALLRRWDRLPSTPTTERAPDLLTGRRLDNAGANIALGLLLGTSAGRAATTLIGAELERWGEAFRFGCNRLAAAELVLNHVETGAMRLVDDGANTFAAWISSPRPAASVQERADWDWWAAFEARRHQVRLD